MAIVSRKPRRSLLALTFSAAVLSLPLALSNGAEALQCPKGYKGAAGKCIMTAEHANKLYKDQQQTERKKAAQQEQNKKLMESLSRGKWNKSGATTAQPNLPNDTTPAKKVGKRQDSGQTTTSSKQVPPTTFTKSAHTPQPSVPDNAPADTKSKGAASEPNAPKGQEVSGGSRTKPPSASSSKPNVPDEAETKSGETKTGDRHYSVSPKPNVPDNDNKQAGRGQRDRDDDARGDKPRTAKARDAGDDDTPRRTAKQKQDDDGRERKAAKTSEEEDAGKRKAARTSGDDASRKTVTTAALGTNGSGTGWTHNNSRMSIASDGDKLTIAYDAPRDGLAEIGIAPGTPLFKGTRDGNKVSGEATTFTRKCGTRTYPVGGTLSDGRVELSGEKPILGGDCKVTGTKREVLVFETGD